MMQTTPPSHERGRALRLRRSLRAQLKDGLAAAEDDRRPLTIRVHDLRTALRRARGVLKLAGPRLRRGGRVEMRTIASMAREMSAVRDAEAIVETFDRLTRKVGDAERWLSAARRRLDARRRALEQDPRVAKSLRRARRTLRRLRRHANRLLHRTASPRALADGFTRGYRKARRAREAAARHETPERLHSWRKAVKNHAFHVKLLAAAGVEGMNDRLRDIQSLGTWLGEDHDLTVLEGVIRAEREAFADPRDHERLSRLLWGRRRAIRLHVRPLGRRLFLARPGAVRRMVARTLVA